VSFAWQEPDLLHDATSVLLDRHLQKLVAVFVHNDLVASVVVSVGLELALDGRRQVYLLAAAGQ
jgi:hypothetical protein